MLAWSRVTHRRLRREVAAGSIISTDPAAGAQVAPGSTVDYVVSLGVEPVTVPDVRGVFAAEDAANR